MYLSTVRAVCLAYQCSELLCFIESHSAFIEEPALITEEILHAVNVSTQLVFQLSHTG